MTPGCESPATFLFHSFIKAKEAQLSSNRDSGLLVLSWSRPDQANSLSQHSGLGLNEISKTWQAGPGESSLLLLLCTLLQMQPGWWIYFKVSYDVYLFPVVPALLFMIRGSSFIQPNSRLLLYNSCRWSCLVDCSTLFRSWSQLGFGLESFCLGLGLGSGSLDYITTPGWKSCGHETKLAC